MRPTPRYLARLLALTIVYYAMVRVGVLFAMINGAISPMWPPSGVAIAALL